MTAASIWRDERYIAARGLMRPGDVIAFAGTRPISKLIGLFSGSNLSHVGMVHTAMEDGTLRVLFTQSTIENGKSGAQAGYLSDVLAAYPGQAWLCPLSDASRARADWVKFDKFIAQAEAGVSYDTPGLFGFLARGIPILGPRICQSQNAKRMFCSGYDTAAFKEAGILFGMNYSQVTPQQLLEMGIYAPGAPIQLIGEPGEIDGYNSI